MYSVAPFYLANFMATLPLEVLPQLALASLQYAMAGLRPGAGHFLTFLLILVLESQCAIALGMLLSASIRSVEAAPKVAPIVVILFLAFSGYFLNEDSIPDWLIWIKYLSFIRYAFQAFSVNEFDGAQFSCFYSDGEPAAVCIQGDAWLQQLSFGDDQIWVSCLALGSLALGFNLLAYIVLVLRRPHFLPLASKPRAAPAAAALAAPAAATVQEV